MEFIKRLTPFDIFNCTLFPHEKFISSNLIMMRIYEFRKDLYYSFNITLPNIIISINDLDLIEKILNRFSPISEKLQITANYLYFIAKTNNKSDPEKNLNIILQEIFNILFTSKYITNDTYFGISFQYHDTQNTRHFLAGEFIEYSNSINN
jgi:hypothetical protein